MCLSPLAGFLAPPYREDTVPPELDVTVDVVDGLELLSESDCRRLLTQEQVGRVAVAVGALAVVFPVNYVMAGGDILFWTGEGTKLKAAVANRVVTFEIDHVDPVSETGWSVLAVGPARERTEPALVAGAKAAGLRSWASGERHHLVAITVETLTGRRIVPTVDVPRERERGWAIGPQSPISALAQPPIRVDPRWSVGALAEFMTEDRVSSVLIGYETAVISRAEVASALRSGLNPDARITTLSRDECVTVEDDVSVLDTAARMLRHELRHVVICDHRGQVTGLVSLHDLVGILLDAMDPAVWVMLRHTLLTAPGLS
jgi:nitroimidazol reductase NimA-like FMN-containing flavoprotein (pyridoxamine 5'-phosphate oxidase superfamily)